MFVYVIPQTVDNWPLCSSQNQHKAWHKVSICPWKPIMQNNNNNRRPKHFHSCPAFNHNSNFTYFSFHKQTFSADDHLRIANPKPSKTSLYVYCSAIYSKTGTAFTILSTRLWQQSISDYSATYFLATKLGWTGQVSVFSFYRMLRQMNVKRFGGK